MIVCEYIYHCNVFIVWWVFSLSAEAQVYDDMCFAITKIIWYVVQVVKGKRIL